LSIKRFCRFLYSLFFSKKKNRICCNFSSNLKEKIFLNEFFFSNFSRDFDVQRIPNGSVRKNWLFLFQNSFMKTFLQTIVFFFTKIFFSNLFNYYSSFSKFLKRKYSKGRTKKFLNTERFHFWPPFSNTGKQSLLKFEIFF